MKLRLLVTGLSVCSGVVMAAATASAAPQMPCTPATMTPTATSIPANLPGFGYTALTAATTDVHLTATSGGATGELQLALGPVADGLLKVAPVQPLVAGTSYRLEYTPFCGYSPYPVTPLEFTATAAAPLPTQVGQATTAPTFTLKDFGTTQVTITAAYTLADEMKPWAQVYGFNIVFDGKLIETKPSFSSAIDAVQYEATGWCDQTSAATTKHTVLLRARLPFAPTVDTAPATLDFVCPAPKIGTPPNNGAVPPTSTSSSSGTVGTGNGAGTTTTATHGGCSTTPGGASSPVSFALLLGLAALVRRKVSGASAAASRT